MTTRRGFITGLISFVTAPAIVKVESLMKLPRIRDPIIITEYWHGVRTSIPISTWRALNQGVPYGKSPAMRVIGLLNEHTDILRELSYKIANESGHDLLPAIQPTRDLR